MADGDCHVELGDCDVELGWWGVASVLSLSSILSRRISSLFRSEAALPVLRAAVVRAAVLRAAVLRAELLRGLGAIINSLVGHAVWGNEPDRSSGKKQHLSRLHDGGQAAVAAEPCERALPRRPDRT